MPWFRKSVYTDNTIILYFLCLTTKILLYFCYTQFSEYVNSKKVGGVNHPYNNPPRYGPDHASDSLHACVYILCLHSAVSHEYTFITNILHKRRNISQAIMTYFV
jgi:hypothetical protein